MSHERGIINPREGGMIRIPDLRRTGRVAQGPLLEAKPFDIKDVLKTLPEPTPDESGRFSLTIGEEPTKPFTTPQSFMLVRALATASHHGVESLPIDTLSDVTGVIPKRMAPVVVEASHAIPKTHEIVDANTGRTVDRKTTDVALREKEKDKTQQRSQDKKGRASGTRSSAPYNILPGIELNLARSEANKPFEVIQQEVEERVEPIIQRLSLVARYEGGLLQVDTVRRIFGIEDLLFRNARLTVKLTMHRGGRISFEDAVKVAYMQMYDSNAFTNNMADQARERDCIPEAIKAVQERLDAQNSKKRSN